MTFGQSWKHTMSNRGVDGALYIALLAAALGNLLPSPADAWIFWRQRVDAQKWVNKEISSKQKWARGLTWYYTAAPVWYITLFAVVYFFGNTTKQKLMLATAIIGGGAIIGVI